MATWEQANDIAKEMLHALGNAIPRKQILLHASFEDIVPVSALDEAIVAIEEGLMKLMELRDE